MALILNEREVAEVLSMGDAVRLLEESFRLHAEGRTSLAPRLVMPLQGDAGNFRIMAAVIPDRNGFGLKTLTGTPGKRAPEDTWFTILHFDWTTGALRAVLPGGYITGVRTGAASGVATRYLAREDASVLGLIGAGFQGRNQVAAVREVRTIRTIRIHDAAAAAAESFAAALREEGDIEVEVVDAPEDAVRGCDVVCAATTTRTPVIEAEWLSPGMHVNSVGANAPVKREVAASVFARCRVVPDFQAQVLEEAGDLMAAIGDGSFQVSDIHAELGAIVAGQAPGREGDEITLFKSVGVAIEDVACASHVYEQALARGLGRRVNLQTG